MKNFSWIIIMVTLTIGLVGTVMVEDEQQEETLYCEMVGIRMDTGNPHLGWPDYKGIYDEVCK